MRRKSVVSHSSSTSLLQRRKRRTKLDRHVDVFDLTVMEPTPMMQELSSRSPLLVRERTMTRKPMQTFTSSSRMNLRKSPIQSSALLPIISLSSFADCKEKLTQLTTSGARSTVPLTPPPLACPTVETKPTGTRSARPLIAPRSPLHHPTIASQSTARPDQSQFFCLMNTPMPSHRAANVSSPKKPINSTQQQLLVPRSHPQFGRFLTYLRLQSFSRVKRKNQQREEKPADPLEAVLMINYSRHNSQIFQSISHFSLDSLPTNGSPTPTPKPRGQSLAPLRQLQRSTSNLINNPRRASINKPSFFLTPPLTPTEDPTCILTASSLLNTPRNSLADESPGANPNELQPTDDSSPQGSRRQQQVSSTNIEFKYRYE